MTRILDVAGLQVHVADSFASRLVGLLGQRALDSKQALLIVPCNNVHTFFMRFAIDVVFLDRDGVILHVAPELRPWRAASCWRAHACLELPVGGAVHYGLVPGRCLAQLAAERLKQ